MGYFQNLGVTGKKMTCRIPQSIQASGTDVTTSNQKRKGDAM